MRSGQTNKSTTVTCVFGPAPFDCSCVAPSGAQEVFVRRSYLQHGLNVEEGAIVIDAGANIGLFSLQCLREARGVQVGDRIYKYSVSGMPEVVGRRGASAK